jgi:transaldolase
MKFTRFFFLPLLVSCFTPPLPPPLIDHRSPATSSARFFLDTAVVDDWMQLLPSGIFYGITTNPQLLERAGEANNISNIHKLAHMALSSDDDNLFYCEEFMCQAWGLTVDEIVGCALALVEPFPRERLIIKIPITELGLQAASQLIRNHNVRVCMTAAYHRKQALSAVAVGADYVAPYLGRMTEAAGKDGKQECRDMQDIVDGLGGDTRVLVASLRDPETLTELAAYGMDTFTFSPDLARKLFFDSWTEQAAAEFHESAERNRW